MAKKMKRKMSLPGHDAAREGSSRERIVINLTTDKKVVRNLSGRIENIFEGIQEPRWPRASNSLCTPLVNGNTPSQTVDTINLTHSPSLHSEPVRGSPPTIIVLTSHLRRPYGNRFNSLPCGRPHTVNIKYIPLS